MASARGGDGMEALPQRTLIAVNALIKIDSELEEIRKRLMERGVEPYGISTTRSKIKEQIGLLYVRAANEMSG